MTFPVWDDRLGGVQRCAGDEPVKTLKTSRNNLFVEWSEPSLNLLLDVSSHTTNIIQHATGVKRLHPLLSHWISK